MRLRPAASEDSLHTLTWRNDPQTIAMSRHRADISLEAHRAWFDNAIRNPDCILFIATENGKRVGMIRFDKASDNWRVSINLAPTERGKGLGYEVLSNAIAAIGPRPLTAEIKAENAASIRIFERCGFRVIGEEDGFLHFARP